MANLATTLKEEITRLARKELKGEAGSLRKASGHQRAEIVALKRRVIELEQKLTKLEKLLAGRTAALAVDRSSPNPRFSAAGLKKLRARLELSAPVLASILGVSAQTIYNWEAGTSRPDAEFVARIAILRKMGKREVKERVARMRSPE